MGSMFHNRLRKRYRHLKKFAGRWPTNAFRVYDRDIPEFAWSVDVYGDKVYLQNIKNRGDDDQLATVLDAIIQEIDVDELDIYYTERERQKGDSQYQKQAEEGERFVVTEGHLKFYVDLVKYVDTGLFLDHRNLRRQVAEDVKGYKKVLKRDPAVLNLFSYTGAFSVWAAEAGARVTSVDMSNTYLSWSEDNFDLNRLDRDRHDFLREDIMHWLPRLQPHQKWDIIILDPPTFSTSKKMHDTLDIQRDHPIMINDCLRHLHAGGRLYFSTNSRSFKLDQNALNSGAKEITHMTMSEDFREGIHTAFLFE